MAALGGDTLTLVDFAKSVNPDGSHAVIAEILAEDNGIVEDALWSEANNATSHRSTIRDGLPAPSWRSVNERVTPTKGTKIQVDDSIGMMEDYSECDVALADLNGNTAAFRFSEDRAHIQGFAHELAGTMFYGNTDTAPKEFMGLAPRYSDVTADSGENIIDAGGSGSDNTSVWLITWGDHATHMVFPKGQAPGGSATGIGVDGSPMSVAGLTVKDLGEQTSETSAGLMQVYRTHFKLQGGMVVKDWRYNARIGSIDVSDLNTLANTVNLITWMIQASERIPSFSRGKSCWYVNRTIREKLRLGIVEKISSNLTWETVEGKRVMMFDDIPVKRCDQILNTESLV